MRKVIAIGIVLLLAFGLASAVFAGGRREESETIRIGFSIADISNPVWVDMYREMQVRAEALGAEIILNDAKQDPNSQISAIENFIASGVDALIVHAFDQEASVPAINRAMEAGLKVVAYDIMIESYDSSLTVENYEFGYTVGEAAAAWINDRLDGNGVVGIVNFPLIPILNERVMGITDALNELAPTANIVQEVSASNPITAVEAVEDLMQAHPDVNVICTTAGLFAFAANEAVNSQNKGSESFGIFTCDASPDVLTVISEGGYIRTAVYTDVVEKGAQMVDTAVALVRGEEVPRDIYFEMIPVTAENVDDFID